MRQLKTVCKHLQISKAELSALGKEFLKPRVDPQKFL